MTAPPNHPKLTPEDIAAIAAANVKPHHIEAELAKRSLYEYMKLAWPAIEPGYKYSDNWHIQAICDHLQAVSTGDIRRLIVNMPPRHMKSLIISVAWPTWDWVNNPHRKFLFGSYASALSIRDAVKSRRLITSPWYQQRFGNIFKMTGDQNTKQRYENDRTGYRIATSVGGQLTGDGGDFIILDDPHNVSEAESDAIRSTTLEWWDQALPTRLNDPKKGAFVIIMQRVHEKDLTGHIMAKEKGWDHLVLPARFEHKPLFQVRSSLGFKDPRTKEGELLWPDRFGEEEVVHLERALGTYGAAGQLQQRPAPAEGGLINTKKFKLHPHSSPLPYLELIIQSYDTAFTDNTQNDPTACTVWGVFTPQPTPKNPAPLPSLILLDAWDEHLNYPDLRKRMKKEFTYHYGDPGRQPDILLIEEKGSGIALVADLQRDGLPIRMYNPLRADKTSRVHQSLPTIDDQRIYLLESKKAPGQPVSWATPFLRHCQFFPNGEHDDYVDTMTQTILYMRDSGWVTLRDRIQDPDPWEDDGPAPKRGNPYAA